MISFLQSIAQHLHLHLADRLNTSILVFPNRRAGLFFCKYLARERKCVSIAPQVTTINTLFDQLAKDSVNTDRIDLIMSLHQVYQEVMKIDVALDDFFFWGQMMLSDFDEIDDHLIDAKRLFVETANLKELDSLFTPNLSEQQRNAIVALFGENELTAQTDDDNIRLRFAKIWNHLALIHTLYARYLVESKRGVYKGLQHKMVIEQLNEELKENDLSSPTWSATFSNKQLIFVGFNALTASEERLFEIAKLFDADFYWDYASPDLRNLDGSLHHYNEVKFPSHFQISYSKEPTLADANKSVNLYRVASGVGQTKVAGWLLKQIVTDSPSLENTAVVLPDEQLLLPMLSSLDRQIDAVNITMGYPMVATPVYALLDYLCQLQLKKRLIDGNYVFYHNDVESILYHSYIKHWEETEQPDDTADSLLTSLFKLRRIYSSPQDLQENDNPLFARIFKAVDKDQFVTYLIDILSFLLETENNANSDSDSQNDEQIFLGQYLDMLQRLNVKFGSCSPLELQGLVRLIKQLSMSETISFRGEPLRGLQIMGALEARALDFNNLIILSANEGVFPKVSSQNTFIPYRVRKAYDLPTHELNDSIESYNFYRMLLHAQNVHLIYDIRDDSDMRGEVSRYVMQLRYKYNVKINDFQLLTEAQTLQPLNPTISVNKSPEIYQRLFDKLTILDNSPNKKAKCGLSPSALKAYLTCSLKYYLCNLEHIGEDDKLEDNIQSNEFGTIVHKALELVYKQYIDQHPEVNNLIDQPVLARWLSADSDVLATVSEQAFRSEYLKNDKPIVGQNAMILDVVKRYVRQVIECDAAYAPFYFIGAEYTFQDYYLTLNDGQQIVLNGSIDRIDLKQASNGRWTLRVVDYKTGTQRLSFTRIDQLFDRSNHEKYNIMQACMYCMVVEQMLRHDFKAYNGAVVVDLCPTISLNTIDIEPHLFFVRNTGDINNFSSNIMFDKNVLLWNPEFSEQYRSMFAQTVSEMLNPEVPFEQTPHKKQCKYCPLGDTCARPTIADY